MAKQRFPPTCFITERGSLTKPSFFNGSNYRLWKGNMKVYLQSKYTRMLIFVIYNDYVHVVTQEDGT